MSLIIQRSFGSIPSSSSLSCWPLHTTYNPLLPVFKRFRHSTNLYPTYLAQDVKGVGKLGDIVLLSAGYARNFIAGTGKGVIFPRHDRVFMKHRHYYKLLGYPIDTMDSFFKGNITAKTKGQSWRSSSSASSNSNLTT